MSKNIDELNSRVAKLEDAIDVLISGQAQMMLDIATLQNTVIDMKLHNKLHNEPIGGKVSSFGTKSIS